MVAAKKQVTTTFTKTKETKNTWAFMEDGDMENHKVGALYIKKSTMPTLDNAEKLSVTITAQ